MISVAQFIRQFCCNLHDCLDDAIKNLHGGESMKIFRLFIFDLVVAKKHFQLCKSFLFCCR